MPQERVSQGFKDIGIEFQINPLNYDLIANKNEKAISRSLKNLMLTNPGERLFNQNIGSKILGSLFENMDEASAFEVREEIINTVINYEPRVELKRVTVEPNYDNNEFNVTIDYTIVGIDLPTQRLSFPLQSVR